MWFRLASAEWETGKHLGAMNVLANAWSVGYNVSGGITKTSGSGSVSKGGTLTATFTLATGATFTSATLTPASAGTVTHTVSSSTVTITIANVSANCTLNVVATSGNTGGGDSGVVTPPVSGETINASQTVQGYFDIFGTSNSTSTRWKYDEYNITGGYTYLVTSYLLASAGMPLVVFFDSSNTFISWAGPRSSSTGTLYTDSIITAPLNAVKMCVNNDTQNLSATTVKVASTSVYPPLTERAQGYYSKDGTLSDMAGWVYSKYNCIENTTYYITTILRGGVGMPLALFYDSSNTLLSYTNIVSTSDEAAYTNEAITTPANCSSIIINFYKSNSTSATVENTVKIINSSSS